MEDFEERFADLDALKPSIAFLINPFEVDIISNGFPISKTLLHETAEGEMELIEMREDVGLKMYHKSATSVNEFWNAVPSEKYKKCCISIIVNFRNNIQC